MTIKAQITLRDGIAHSKALDAHVQEKVDKLQRFCQNMIDCQVVIELANNKHRQGNLHNTRIAIAVPGKELVATHSESENLFASIDGAFENMKREVDEYVSQMRGDIRNHKSLVSGKIVRLFNGDGFGFIEGLDGTEFYFNANHVSDPAFHKLTIGMNVHFIEEMGTDGPQARHVKQIDK